MSDTPRTDRQTGWVVAGQYGPSTASDLYTDPKGPFVHAMLARELERENARLRLVVRAAYLHELDQMQMPDSGPLRLSKEQQRQLGRDLAELGPLPNVKAQRWNGLARSMLLGA